MSASPSDAQTLATKTHSAYSRLAELIPQVCHQYGRSRGPTLLSCVRGEHDPEAYGIDGTERKRRALADIHLELVSAQYPSAGYRVTKVAASGSTGGSYRTDYFLYQVDDPSTREDPSKLLKVVERSLARNAVGQSTIGPISVSPESYARQIDLAMQRTMTGNPTYDQSLAAFLEENKERDYDEVMKVYRHFNRNRLQSNPSSGPPPAMSSNEPSRTDVAVHGPCHLDPSIFPSDVIETQSVQERNLESAKTKADQRAKNRPKAFDTIPARSRPPNSTRLSQVAQTLQDKIGTAPSTEGKGEVDISDILTAVSTQLNFPCLVDRESKYLTIYRSKDGPTPLTLPPSFPDLEELTNSTGKSTRAGSAPSGTQAAGDTKLSADMANPSSGTERSNT
ncbi:hypothetical protein IAU59_005559 [Kwoniella sp. CBS 9459]